MRFGSPGHVSNAQAGLDDTSYYRCVRRAYLRGIDHLTGENHEHRRQWLVTKMKSLSSIFSMDLGC